MTRRHQQRSVTVRRMAIVLSATAGLSVAAIHPGRTVGAACAGHLAPIGNDASFQRGPVTIDRSAEVTPQIIIGSEGDDDLKGGSANDVICGRGGNDHIEGGAGDDEIYGDTGSDTIIGGLGADSLYAGWGLDEYIDAHEMPPAADTAIEGGLGFKSCVLDAVDAPIAHGCTPLIVAGRSLSLNPFPLPFP